MPTVLSIIQVNTNGPDFKGDRDTFLNTLNNHLMLIVTFTRTMAEDVLGITPEKLQPLYALVRCF